MNAVSRLVPGITTMIRTDHAAVLSTFHKYRPDASPSKKKAIVDTICTAVEIHARLEEELFYPEMRRVQPDLVGNSAPEHNEMRRHIASLRAMAPSSDDYDRTFLDLMRLVIHHVADEETVLLPAAERALGERNGELGMAMTRRRMQLAAPRVGDIATNTVRTHPGLVAGALALLAVGGYLAWRGTSSRSRAARWLERAPKRMSRLMHRPTQRLLGYVR